MRGLRGGWLADWLWPPLKGAAQIIWREKKQKIILNKEEEKKKKNEPLSIPEICRLDYSLTTGGDPE